VRVPATNSVVFVWLCIRICAGTWEGPVLSRSLRGRHRFHSTRLELQAVLLIPYPATFRDQPLPSGHRGQRPDDRTFLSAPRCLDTQYTEAAVVVVESDPLNQPGDFLGHGPAFRDGGIHEWKSFSHGRTTLRDLSRSSIVRARLRGPMAVKATADAT
jgi:hypothetical protein